MSSEALNAPSQRRGYFAVDNASSPHFDGQHSYPPSPSPSASPNASNANLQDAVSPFRTPSASRPVSTRSAVSDRYNLPADPVDWGAELNRPEPDDALHDPRIDTKPKSRGLFAVAGRGFRNLGCLAVLAVLLIGLFLGVPLGLHFHNQNEQAAAASAAAAATPASALPSPVSAIANWGMIDVDTPEEFHTIQSYHDPTQELELVFSDEFETEGRSFYPGDDPYWEAVDLHYWSTSDLEWYDPAQVTTRTGALEITMDAIPDADISQNHNMSYRSGMLSTWNKMCFTGGLILASVNLPGTTNVKGLWPAVWTMGNLGRAGYGATLEGMWPYSYDSCDVGTLPNQTNPDGLTPTAALTSGSSDYDGSLSYLPGQRLSRCVCPGESHPGPIHEDGTYVGRSAPEIDIVEAQLGGPGDTLGQVSQSAQWAPFDAAYNWNNQSGNMVIYNETLSHQNSYSGGIWQEATSVVTTTNQDCYQLKNPCYATHGFEYVPGFDDAVRPPSLPSLPTLTPPLTLPQYITWITDNKRSWTLLSSGVGPNPQSQISARPIPQEPLYILANLGISHGFVYDIDFEHLTFPAKMRVDWVRVYQPKGKVNVGCEPEGFPTQGYINTYIEAYTNANLTTWEGDFKQPVPKSRLNGGLLVGRTSVCSRSGFGFVFGGLCVGRKEQC
ncbi:GH16 domain-containing protein [Mycena kentingensis (nom. inval.)]|nr:GH16 domain-containing protein [Mycena kentingensis (nom. inval.)]